MAIDIGEYAQNSLQAIQDSDFIPQSDWNELMLMKDELQNTFEKKQMWRTETEMRVSVLNDLKHPTKASKYWQAIREQSVFFENLVMLSFDYRRNNVEIRKISKKLELETDEDVRDLLAIDLEEALFKKKNMEVGAKDRMRELKLWSKIKAELNDGSFDDQDVNTHQLVSYAVQFINQRLQMGDNGSPSEIQNLVGQLQTTLSVCKQTGVLEQVLEKFPLQISSRIIQEVNLLT